MTEPLIFVSFFFLFADPLSSLALADMVMRHRNSCHLTLPVRALIALMAVGFVGHAAEQFMLIQNYRPPRVYSWVLILLPLHAVIWLIWALVRARHVKGKQP